MDHVIVRTVARAAPEDVAALRPFSVATIHEAMGRRGLMDVTVRPVQSERRIHGTAVTVRCHVGDNLMLHAAVEYVREGDVVVLATASPSTEAMLGDLLATSLRAHGCVGVITNAGVRDSAELRAMEFPVWAAAVHAQGTVKATAGSVNVPIVCAGSLVRPGDVVVADDDGVVVIPREEAASVAVASKERIEREAQVRSRLAAGKLGVDLYGLRSKLDDLGVRCRG